MSTGAAGAGALPPAAGPTPPVQAAEDDDGPSPDVDALLAGRLRRGSDGGVLDDRTADLVLTSDSGTWTVQLRRGEVSARRGRSRRTPDTVVTGGPRALAELVSGTASGVRLFLDGRITVRGSLALALQLDGLFRDSTDDPTTPRSHLADVDGVRTAYLSAGPSDAPPVVLLHGLGSTNASMLPLLTGLARDHRVLAPDLPGFGASAAPRASYSFAWLAQWLLGFTEATATGPATLIGNSLGGRVALEAGLSSPGAVKDLVLLCPSPAWRRLRQLAPAARLVRPGVPLLRGLPIVPTHSLVVEFMRFMFSDPDRLPRSWYDAGADEAVRVLRSPAHRVAFYACGRHIVAEQAGGQRGFWSRLPGLEPPALFIWGERDRLVPASFARHVVRALPDAQSVVLPDSGHVPHYEHEETTLALVRQFLAHGPDSRSEAPADMGADDGDGAWADLG